MRTLIYKRTHSGDPDRKGRFGIYDCMGRVRGWKYDAVIGVGGTGAEASKNDLAGKVNWVGLGAHRHWVAELEAPIVTFDHFLNFGTEGPLLASLAPRLAHHIYSRNVRVMLRDASSTAEGLEVKRILGLAKKGSPSSRAHVRRRRPGC